MSKNLKAEQKPEKETIELILHKGCIDAAAINALLEDVFKDSKYKFKIRQNSPRESRLEEKINYSISKVEEGSAKHIFILDLNISNMSPKGINDLINRFHSLNGKGILIDHHDFRVNVNDNFSKESLLNRISESKYMHIDEKARSAAGLVYNLISDVKCGREPAVKLPQEIIDIFNNYPLERFQQFEGLIKIINRIDTVGPNGLDEQAKDYADLFLKLSFNKFVRSMRDNPRSELTQADLMDIYDFKQEKNAKLIDLIKNIKDNIQIHSGIFYSSDKPIKFLKIISSDDKLVSNLDIIEHLKKDSNLLSEYGFIEFIRSKDMCTSIVPLNNCKLTQFLEKLQTNGHKNISSRNLSNSSINMMLMRNLPANYNYHELKNGKIVLSRIYSNKKWKLSSIKRKESSYGRLYTKDSLNTFDSCIKESSMVNKTLVQKEIPSLSLL